MLDTLWSSHVEPALRARGLDIPDSFLEEYRNHLLNLDAELMGLAEKVGKITALCAMLFPVPSGPARDCVTSDTGAKFTLLQVDEKGPPGTVDLLSADCPGDCSPDHVGG